MLVPKSGIWIIPTSLFIREHLKTVGRDYGLNMWHKLRNERTMIGQKTGSWQVFRNCLWNLKKLGLIRPVEERDSEYPNQKRIYYEIVPEKIHSKAWYNPRAFLYPDSYRFNRH